ncbi:MAG: OmpH family outer membrane protein [Gemmatimonadota bacterium]|nr:OmpH family outer membrane protein [Gemmatimonadota bacterium]
MRHFFSSGTLLTVALLLGGVASASAQTPKLGYINTQKLIAEAPGAGAAQQAFERDMTAYRTQVQALEQELQRMQAEYQSQLSTLSETARQQRQQQMQQRFTAAQDSVGKLEQLASARQQQLGQTMQPIMAQIKTVIEAVRAQESYSIIFDAGDGGILAADPSLDLTDRVLARLRAAPAAGG